MRSPKRMVWEQFCKMHLPSSTKVRAEGAAGVEDGEGRGESVLTTEALSSLECRIEAALRMLRNSKYRIIWLK
jgi:hypothetical protein